MDGVSISEIKLGPLTAEPTAPLSDPHDIAAAIEAAVRGRLNASAGEMVKCEVLVRVSTLIDTETTMVTSVLMQKASLKYGAIDNIASQIGDIVQKQRDLRKGPGT